MSTLLLSSQTQTRRRNKGAAMVELALILPLLILLSFIAAEFGRALYQYNLVTKSVRDAVRYLSVQTPGTRTAETRNLIVFGNTAGTGTPLAPGLTIANVTAPTWQNVGSNPVINAVTVTVTGYTFTSVFTNVLGLGLGSFTYSNISASMRGVS